MRRRATRALLLAALTLGAPAARAQVPVHLSAADAHAAFRSASEACAQKAGPECIDGLQRLLAAGYGGAALHYNLGTAYLRQGQLGLAVVHLELALRADPGDEDARANLEQANRMRLDRLVAPAETGGEQTLVARLASHTRRDAWALAFLGLWTGGWLLLVTRRFWVRPGWRLAALLGGLAALALSLPCGGVTAAHAWTRSQVREAVVVAQSLPVREGPVESLRPVFEVHEGLKVRVLDRDGAFTRIRLANGLQGWVPGEGLVDLDR